MIVQTALIDSKNLQTRTIASKNMKASFFALSESSYEVVLEINSNKFFITMDTFADQISAFEVVSAKGFFEFSSRIILMLRQLVQYFYWKMSF